MHTIKVEVSAESSKVGAVVTSGVTTNVEEDLFDASLGKVLYAIESMGYPFTTDEIYQSAIKAFNNSSISTRYVVIFSNDILKVSVRRFS